MTVAYRLEDANEHALDTAKIAVLGYGNLGRPIALNLRDNGLNVIIGNQDDEYGWQARRDGFEVQRIHEAAAGSDFKLMLMPDETMPETYLMHIAPTLKPGHTVIFASGYCVAFGLIEPPPFIDVLLLAPRTIGTGVREGYLNTRGFPSFVAVGQDASGKAWDRLLCLALKVGSLRAGALELTFRQEAELDLFVQQVMLPAMHAIIYMSAELLIREGYPPQATLLELYMSGELGYGLAKAGELGLLEALKLYSLTGQYGILSREDRFREPKFRLAMEQTLQEIRSGKFAQDWSAEYNNGYPRLESLRRKRKTMALTVFEQQLIELLRSVQGGEPLK